MTQDHTYELRRLLTSASAGMIAYKAWAQRARRERYFNIARLLGALGASKQIRAMRAFNDLGEVGTTERNVDRALESMEPEAVATGPITGTTPLVRELLTRAQRALAENRDLRFDELDDLYVCSTCGDLREGQNVQPCPVCGTVPEAHRPFRAADFFGTLGPHAITGFLEHTPAALRKLVQGLEDKLLVRRINGEPSLKEMIGHLADMDGVFRERAWLILETNQPTLPLAHPPRLESATKYRDLPIEAVLETFQKSRQQTLTLLRGLTSAAWHRTGRHVVYGQVDLLHQGNWVVSHERTHLVEMAQLRHDLIVSDETCCEPVELPEVLVDNVAEGE
jgi:rubrerythrin